MSKDSPQTHFEAYWLQTVLEDRAESAAAAGRCRPGGQAMRESVDDRIMWLANNVICMPTRRDATRAAFDKIGHFRAADMPTLPCTDSIPSGFAEWARRHDHPVLALA